MLKPNAACFFSLWILEVLEKSAVQSKMEMTIFQSCWKQVGWVSKLCGVGSQGIIGVEQVDVPHWWFPVVARLARLMK